jgi:hypothetical protein
MVFIERERVIELWRRGRLRELFAEQFKYV